MYRVVIGVVRVVGVVPAGALATTLASALAGTLVAALVATLVRTLVAALVGTLVAALAGTLVAALIATGLVENDGILVLLLVVSRRLVVVGLVEHDGRNGLLAERLVVTLVGTGGDGRSRQDERQDKG